MSEYKSEPIIGSVWEWKSYASEPTEYRCVQITPKSILYLREYEYPCGSGNIKKELNRKHGIVGADLFATKDDAINARYTLLLSRVESAKQLVIQREQELATFNAKWTTEKTK